MSSTTEKTAGTVKDSASWRKLEELAKRPFDLSVAGALSADNRIEKMVCDGAGLRLLYATQRLDRQVLEAFQEFADEHRLIDRFREMRRGEVVNRIDGWESENRQVLHTSTRDIFSDQPREPVSAGQARAELKRLRGFLAELDSGTLLGSSGQPFSTLVNVGIGGSDLGPRAVCEALAAYRLPGRKVAYIANVDPDDAAAVLASVNLAETLVTVVSKSGSTQETRTNEQLVRKALAEAGLDPAAHLLAVTGAGSPMDDPGRYRRCFYLYDYIGGRYSCTSMVGAVLLGFSLGWDGLMAFLEGAHEVDNLAENRTVTDNLPLLLALIGVWNRNFLGYPNLAVLPYSQALHRFPAHLQQCDMESNGKSVTRCGQPVGWKTGPVVWGEPGTNGQHAFFQLLHQGTEIVPAEFIGFRSSQYGQDLEVDGTSSQQKLAANLLAQSLALAVGQDSDNPNRCFDGNRPSSIIIGDRLDPGTMGRLLALYEAKIVFQGFSWNINSFDQEGVQLGKRLAEGLLDLQKGARKNASTAAEQLLRSFEK